MDKIVKIVVEVFKRQVDKIEYSCVGCSHQTNSQADHICGSFTPEDLETIRIDALNELYIEKSITDEEYAHALHYIINNNCTCSHCLLSVPYKEEDIDSNDSDSDRKSGVSKKPSGF